MHYEFRNGIGVESFGKEVLEKFRETKGDEYMNSCEQKTVGWSEEDEKSLKLSLENLTELKNRFGEKYGKVGDCIDWLESLKERMKGE